MQAIRPYLTLLIVPVFLPWAAFAAQIPGAPAQGIAPHAQLRTSSEPSVTTAPLCPGLAQPGTPCNPVFGVLPDITGLIAMSPPALRPAAIALRLIGRSPPPLLGPPKA